MTKSNSRGTRCEEAERLEKVFSRRKREWPHHVRKLMYKVLFLLSSLVNRMVEIFIASLFGLCTCFPLLVVLLIRKVFTGTPVFDRIKIHGRGGKLKEIRYFNLKNTVSRKLFLFYHVITGELSLVGVDVRQYGSSDCILGDSYLLSSKPGIFSLWFIRKSSKIAHEGQHAVEWEYVFRRSLPGDILLLLKTIPAAFFHEEASHFSASVNLFGIEFQNWTMQKAVENVIEESMERNGKTVFFVNPDCLNKIFTDKKYFQVLNQSALVFPDGIGVHIGCKILRTPLRENVNGTDMFPFICQQAEKKGLSMFLLGGKEGIAIAMADRLKQTYPSLKIVGTMHGYFDHEKVSPQVVEMINKVRPNLLFVAFGAPVQEKWLARYGDSLQAGVMVGVGGLFDFYSGSTRRAPRWMREIGMEWSYRLLQEPGRMWKRYIIGNPLFLCRVIRWKIFTSNSDNT